MKKMTQSLTVMGTVLEKNAAEGVFSVQCLSGDVFPTYITPQTSFQVLQNLDSLNNDRVPDPPDAGLTPQSAAWLIEKYVLVGQLLVVQGVYQINDESSRFDGRTVCLLASTKDRYLFEETHWWITQTARLADQWLDSLFGDKRTYAIDDWVTLYHTDLNILGLPTNDDIQECAVLSRLIYGLSAAYLIVGDDRYRQAAEAAVRFQRDAFRSISHDGTYCFWAYGRRKGAYGTELLVPSQSGDDVGSIPLYEQIYALAGLANYYRISLDWEVLEDIRRTIRAFNDFFLDEKRDGDPAFQGEGGYFSHIDYSTMRPDRNQNPNNDLKKNWNSVGDHIPAYLINLLLSLDPQPLGSRLDLADVLQVAREMLDRVTTLILDKFPDPNPNVPYVNERFFANWKADHTYSWQQNRAVVGHNFKIAWNLTRVANYYETLAAAARRPPGPGSSRPNMELAKKCDAIAKRCMCLANRLGKSMTDYGIDAIRGGCFDAVERNPSNGMPIEFTWGNTKDFWQQEQAILAYLILFGHTGEKLYLDMARRTEAFWNTFFLDREHRGMYFRVTDNGLPVVQGGYEVRGGHSDASGYHCFELNYLAHIYNRAYVSVANKTDSSFCLHFKPSKNAGVRSINVLPDFIAPNRVQIEQVRINGVPRSHADPNYFQIELGEGDLGCNIDVIFCAANQPASP
jgi:mannose/cellobiose epimerase-like protein (N-acyl-D-glucosamine 2-epimerase family)